MKVSYMNHSNDYSNYKDGIDSLYISDGEYTKNAEKIIINVESDIDVLYIDCNNKDIEIISKITDLNIHIIGNLVRNTITIYSYNGITNLNIFGEQVGFLSIKARVENLLVNAYIYSLGLPKCKLINKVTFAIEPSIIINKPLVDTLISTTFLTSKIEYNKHYDIHTLISIDEEYDVSNIPNIVKNIAKYIL